MPNSGIIYLIYMTIWLLLARWLAAALSWACARPSNLYPHHAQWLITALNREQLLNRYNISTILLIWHSILCRFILHSKHKLLPFIIYKLPGGSVFPPNVLIPIKIDGARDGSPKNGNRLRRWLYNVVGDRGTHFTGHQLPIICFWSTALFYMGFLFV